jgi:hypothetical protein
MFLFFFGGQNCVFFFFSESRGKSFFPKGDTLKNLLLTPILYNTEFFQLFGKNPWLSFKSLPIEDPLHTPPCIRPHFLPNKNFFDRGWGGMGLHPRYAEHARIIGLQILGKESDDFSFLQWDNPRRGFIPLQEKKRPKI